MIPEVQMAIRRGSDLLKELSYISCDAYKLILTWQQMRKKWVK